jgi:hypothetical protein
MLRDFQGSCNEALDGAGGKPKSVEARGILLQRRGDKRSSGALRRARAWASYEIKSSADMTLSPVKAGH